MATTAKSYTFDANTMGWSPYKSSIALWSVAGFGHNASNGCCQATSNQGTPGSYAMIETNPSIFWPALNDVYTATAWVKAKAGNAAVGKQAKIVLVDNATNVIAAQSSAVTLTTSWQQVTVTITITAAKDYKVAVGVVSGAYGDVIYVDDVVVSYTTPAVTAASLNGSAARKNLLFSTTSPWNVKADGALAVGQAGYLNDLETAYASDPAVTWTTNPPIIIGTGTQHGPPIWYADADTPARGITMTPGSSVPWNTAPDYGSYATIRIPNEAVPDTGSDHHMIVWDIVLNKVYEFWNVTKTGSGNSATFTAYNGATFDANGSGVQIRPGATHMGSARASGVALSAGLIRYQEFLDGVIPHALAFAYPGTHGKKYASANTATGKDSLGAWGIASSTDNDASRQLATNIPEGARLRLKRSGSVGYRDPTVICGGLKTSTDPRVKAKWILWQALYDYGMFVVDNSGGRIFYAEDLLGKSVSWGTLLDVHDTYAFKSSDFEVLTMASLVTFS